MPAAPLLSNVARKQALEDLLLRHAALWRTSPFKVPSPAWCAAHPGLTESLLALDDATVAALRGDNRGLIGLLAGYLPDLAELQSLIELPFAPAHALPEIPDRFFRDIPGRKQAQIKAYAAAAGKPEAPLLEWCAGKGHLGRLLGRVWGTPVHSLEIDPALCHEGGMLARHARLDAAQIFIRADALAPESAHLIAGRHGMALHACGDLHRALVRAAASQASPAVQVVPCCYYRSRDRIYQPFMPSPLSLTVDDLHLAVNDTVTASSREQRQSARAKAWKLAFQAWRGELTGDPAYHPLKPVPAAWMREGFAGWCRRLAEREGITWATPPDWNALEARGMALLARVQRLELVRLAFRRAIELWLLMDMAVFLEHRGYRVSVMQFCPPRLTPRNLMLSAQRT